MRDPDHVDTATRQRLEGYGHPAQITAYQAQKCAAILEARSAEAKALGIPMGYPWFKLEATAAQHGLVAKSSNYELYGQMASRIFSILSRFSAWLEIYSIDEAFLGLRGTLDELHTVGQQIKADVLQRTGLPVCVGIAKTTGIAEYS